MLLLFIEYLPPHKSAATFATLYKSIYSNIINRVRIKNRWKYTI